MRATSWAGTELYMAPEQLNKQQYGSEVDWWALGGLTWEMATGDHPFYANSRKTINYNILKKKLVVPKWLPANTHSLLKGLLTRDPTKRLGHEGGAEEVKAHPFFKTLDFEKLLNREIEAPLRSHAKVPLPLCFLLMRCKNKIRQSFCWISGFCSWSLIGICIAAPFPCASMRVWAAFVCLSLWSICVEKYRLYTRLCLCWEIFLGVQWSLFVFVCLCAHLVVV